MATSEPEPGHWVMADPYGRPYGDIRIIRAGGEVGYKAEFRGQVAGYFTNLKAACMCVHQAHIASVTPGTTPQDPHAFPDLS